MRSSVTIWQGHVIICDNLAGPCDHLCCCLSLELHLRVVIDRNLSSECLITSPSFLPTPTLLVAGTEAPSEEEEGEDASRLSLPEYRAAVDLLLVLAQVEPYGEGMVTSSRCAVASRIGPCAAGSHMQMRASAHPC
jgi:hypothetical protein